MNDKIYKNREVLRNLAFDVSLNGRDYQFKIFYVNENRIKVGISVSYSEMILDEPDSLPGILKEVILENSTNKRKPLSRQANISKQKLKNTQVNVGGVDFEIETVTNSNVVLVKFLDYDGLLNSTEAFTTTLRSFVEDNLLENPPEVKNIPKSQFKEYIPSPGYWALEMYFQEVGHVRKSISEERLERSRELHKKEAEEGKRNREKMEKLDKELGLDKPLKSKNLDKFFK